MMYVNQLLVSVLMITYNSSKYIRESIESILCQSYTNFELVICDDNSTDDTWDVISAYHDSRIRKYKNQINLGEYSNRNNALSLAQGEYLLFIDGDDILYSHGLEFMIKFAYNYPECAMIIAKPWMEHVIYPKQITPHQFYCFEYIDYGICGINFTKVLFKSSIIKKYRFKEGVRLGDLYIQYLLALQHNSVIIPDAATWWRRNSGQASEKLLNDYSFYLMHELWIKLEMLQCKECPLTSHEVKIAYLNIYGNYLRYILKKLFKLNIKTVMMLYKKYPIPAKYFSSVFKTQHRNYFSKFSGSNPLRD